MASSNTQMHTPAAPRGKQPSEAQQASFWDNQIANGNLSMCSVKYPTYVNVMLYGESGLGKTVSAELIQNLHNAKQYQHESVLH
jgi:transcriptional regulator with AAA-type ATPase domain